MKPAPFEYLRAASVPHCLDLLAEHGDDTKLLSGGQSLVPLMNLRLARPEVVVDLNALRELDYVHSAQATVEVGAMVRHADLAASKELLAGCPILPAAAAWIGYPAIRHRGTLGGSLGHADPAAELPCACVALGAEVVVRGPEGERRIRADDFFVSHFTTSMAPDEMILAARFPVLGGTQGWAFEEFARKTGDFAVACAAAVATVSGGRVEELTVAVGGVGGRPVRARRPEALLVGAAPPTEPDPGVADAVTAELRSIGGTDEFRSHVAGVLAARAVAQACRRAAERGKDGE